MRWSPRRAEAHNILRTKASLDASRIIVGIAISNGADRLESPGVVARVASQSIPEHPPAAILICVEHIAGAAAGDHLPARVQRQLRRTVFPEVTVTADGGAVLLALEGNDDDGQVEPIHEADVVVVDVPEGELGDRGGWAPRGGAVEGQSTAARLAGSIAVPIKAASRPAPDSAAPVSRGCVDCRLPWLKCEPAATEVLAVGNSRPHCLLAVVHYSEGPCALRLYP